MAGILMKSRRTCYCGELKESDVGKTVILKGWAARRRDHGGVIFIDLRDRSGFVQVVFKPDVLPKEEFDIAHDLKVEYVIAVKGEVIFRTPETINPNIPTGKIEVVISHFELLNTSNPVPFKLDEYTQISEETRLKYRYLDLRRPEMQKNMMLRSKLYGIVRNYLSNKGFVEFETPILTKSTPEGARDFLVPSRLSHGCFYALPQSPQLFKQLLMVAGYDKYFQIARCFRDEDFRANRQPEFTQIDLEMSFVTPEDIFEVMEGLIKEIFDSILNIDIKIPFPRMPYREAMLKYGSDKPDLRFGMEISDVTELFKENCELQVFKDILAKGGTMRGFVVRGGADISRKQLDDYTKFVSIYGSKGLAWFKVNDPNADPATGIQSPLAKFFKPETMKQMLANLNAGAEDIIFLICDKEKVVCDSLGALRLQIAKDRNLIQQNVYNFCWIVDFPMFEYDEKEKRLSACHHPFTSPNLDDLDLLDTDPQKVRAVAYDLCLNGEEIGGGSIRIHSTEVQSKVFKAIGLSSEKANERFGFLLEALSYGTPPHGGLAFGFDRIMMILLNESSIREVIPFPKTQSGVCLMTNAPGSVDDDQLKELSIKIIPKP